MNYLKTIGILLFGLLCFMGGNIWQKHTLLDSGTMLLTEALTLQANSTELGRLPKGTVLYPYSLGPSTDTYVVFINTKNRNLLKHVSFKEFMTVAPIDGFRN